VSALDLLSGDAQTFLAKIWASRIRQKSLAQPTNARKPRRSQSSYQYYNLRVGQNYRGVQIQFPRNADNRYRAGDYWLIPARVATGDVIWPKVPEGNKQVAKPLPPHGIDHHYAPLAVISVDGRKITVDHDCRRVFNHLAN